MFHLVRAAESNVQVAVEAFPAVNVFFSTCKGLLGHSGTDPFLNISDTCVLLNVMGVAGCQCSTLNAIKFDRDGTALMCMIR